MGRHGGINILHQKSWHVWRLDNRLRVERDELQHAAKERERKETEDRAAFTANVAELRRRASGEEPSQLTADVDAQPATSLAQSTPSSSSSSQPASAVEKGEKDSANSYKYGMVTLSNLKQAEKDLDQTLKRRRTDKRPTANYWGSGNLGSGPHINLFEEAEREGQSHVAEHQKQIQYTERNNELAEKSKMRPFSEFDEIASNVPWYMRTSKKGAGEAEVAGEVVADAIAVSPSAARSLQVSPPAAAAMLRRRWSESHGQAVLRVKSSCKAKSESEEKFEEKLQEKLEDTHDVKTELTEGIIDTKSRCLGLDSLSVDVRSSSSESRSDEAKMKKRSKKDKKQSKKDKKAKKEAKKERRRAQERSELAALRRQREEREVEERGRIVRVLGGGGNVFRGAAIAAR